MCRPADDRRITGPRKKAAPSLALWHVRLYDESTKICVVRLMRRLCVVSRVDKIKAAQKARPRVFSALL